MAELILGQGLPTLSLDLSDILVSQYLQSLHSFYHTRQPTSSWRNVVLLSCGGQQTQSTGLLFREEEAEPQQVETHPESHS